jgi:hypothetical protein
MGPRNFAFLSFLDLISCAFGAAILIFLVAVTSDDSQGSGTTADVLLIRCHKSGKPVEVQFRLKDPKGRLIHSAGKLPAGYRRFIARSQEQSTSFMIIPKPIPGIWTIQAYWANESIADGESATAKIEVLHPRLQAGEVLMATAEFSPRNRYSPEVVAEIREESGKSAAP